MKRPLLVLSVLLVFGTIFMVGCAQPAPAPAPAPAPPTPVQETPAQIVEDVTPQEAFALIQENQNNPDFIIVDVRTPGEFAEGHIENAINIDFRSEIFRDDINKLDKDKAYLVYCLGGVRSARAVSVMEELNFREVYNMTGGTIGWKEAGLPTVK